MTYQAHFELIRVKTGNTPDDFRALAAERGLTTFRDLKAWLKTEYDLGDGHAYLIANHIVAADQPPLSTDEKVAARFSGTKAHWRGAYDTIIAEAGRFGADFKVMPTTTYISLVRGGKKFAIVDPATAGRLDVGLKLKGIEPAGRLTAAGKWNNMVTHRVRIGHPDEIDAELLGWLRQAYDAV
jgi:hypothetical protein